MLSLSVSSSFVHAFAIKVKIFQTKSDFINNKKTEVAGGVGDRSPPGLILRSGLLQLSKKKAWKRVHCPDLIQICFGEVVVAG